MIYWMLIDCQVVSIFGFRVYFMRNESHQRILLLKYKHSKSKAGV